MFGNPRTRVVHGTGVRDFPHRKAEQTRRDGYRMRRAWMRRKRMEAAASGTAGHYTFEEKRRRVFAIMAASSGNLVEWFDFYVYAFTAIYFAPSFFPKSDETVQLLQAAAVFAFG